MSSAGFASLLGTDAPADRRHVEDFNLNRLEIDPTINYRWGSKEAMEADLKREEEVDGETVNTFEVLVDSIKEAGRVQEPIGVVERDGRNLVIYGFTRAIAARKAGLKKIAAYIYDSSISEIEIRTLQLAENSAKLKRKVNWVSMVEAYYRLLEDAEKLVDSIPKDNRPRGDSGRRLTPKQIATEHLARVLGQEKSIRYVANMRSTLKSLPAKLVQMVKTYDWSYPTTKEFVSEGRHKPFSGDFITKVVEEIRAKKPSMLDVTPEDVRQARDRAAKVSKTVYAGETPRTPSQTTVLRVVSGGDDRRLSAGTVRDVCVDIVTANLPSFETNLEGIKKSWLWYQIIGMGMSTGEVMLPACAVSRALASEKDSKKATAEVAADTKVIDRQHRNSANTYATGIVVQALLRAEVQRRAGDVNSWMAAFSGTDGSKTMNRVAFSMAVREALNEAAASHRPMTLNEVFKLAFDDLTERVVLAAPRVRAQVATA